MKLYDEFFSPDYLNKIRITESSELDWLIVNCALNRNNSLFKQFTQCKTKISFHDGNYEKFWD